MADKRWMRQLRQEPPPTRWYRVEHRDGDGVHALGQLADVAPHHATLAPFASRLAQEGAAGDLVLVDETTGADVARQDVNAGPRRGPTRQACRGQAELNRADRN